MDVFQSLGKVALGSRLRRLGDVFAADAARIYEVYDVELQPKWFPVFHLLSRDGESSVTTMAKRIGCTHPVVSQAVKEMTRAGLVEPAESGDARRTVVRLSERGQAMVPNLELQMEDVREAVETLLGQMQSDFWKAIEEIESLLEEKNLYARVMEQRKQRESRHVEIVDCEPEHYEAFKRLNCQWIEEYFELEEADLKSLDHPKEYLLDTGGCILVARYKGEVVGVCGLRNMDGESYEVVKMAVAEHARGKNIGWMLGQAIEERARELGARRLFIESNTRLKAAMRLYAKLGFKRFVGPPSPYEKCNIQLEKEL